MNGAGKTTLFSQLSAGLLPSEGQILLNGVDVTFQPVHHRVHAGIARSYQSTSVFPEFSVLQNVMFAVQTCSGHSFSFWKPVASDGALRMPALAALEEVGIADKAGMVVSTLAHGARRQLEIAMTLAMKPPGKHALGPALAVNARRRFYRMWRAGIGSPVHAERAYADA